MWHCTPCAVFGVEAYSREVEFSRIRPISPDKVDDIWFVLRRANTVNSTPCVVLDRVLELYFSENGTLELVIFGRNSREYWVNPLFQRRKSEYSKLF